MLITSLALASVIVLTAVDEKPLVCPMMGEAVAKDAPVVEYAGTSYAFCCAGCDTRFAKDPTAAIKKNQKIEKDRPTIGLFLFDPVSRNRILAKDAKATVDYSGVRYNFESAANLEAFNKDAKKYASAPRKESLTCPVTGKAIASYSKASSYVNYKDVRYYFYCAGCEPAFNKDPDKYAGKKVGGPKAIPQKAG